MTPAVALLDANVLYPAPLRDLLLQLAFMDLYQARWSAEIDAEWTRNLLAARPELADRIERTRAAMHRALPDALVTGYAALIPNLSLPDQNDACPGDSDHGKGRGHCHLQPQGLSRGGLGTLRLGGAAPRRLPAILHCHDAVQGRGGGAGLSHAALASAGHGGRLFESAAPFGNDANRRVFGWSSGSLATVTVFSPALFAAP